VVGRGSRRGNEVGERGGVRCGVYLVRLEVEDDPVDEDHEASVEDECIAVAATRLLSVAVGAEHGDQRMRRRLLVNGGAKEGCRGLGAL
jgi:hypothetical protein